MSSDQLHQPELSRRSRGERTWLRRVIPPLLMLVVAYGIYLYSQQQAEERDEVVRHAAQQLCHEVAQMPHDGAMPAMARQLGASLTTVQQLYTAIEAAPKGESLVILVERGDAARPYGTGSATHRAQVQLGGRVVITLRFLYEAEMQSPRLIGYYLP